MTKRNHFISVSITIFLYFCFISCEGNNNEEKINPANILGEWRYIVDYGNSEVVLSFNDSIVYDCFYINGKTSYKGAEKYTYSIQGDSLIINYEYSNSEYKILKLTEDSLILQTLPIIESENNAERYIDGSIEKYYRLKK